MIIIEQVFISHTITLQIFSFLWINFRACSWHSCPNSFVERWSWLSTRYWSWNWVLSQCSRRY